jgi:hypothetical protein
MNMRRHGPQIGDDKACRNCHQRAAIFTYATAEPAFGANPPNGHTETADSFVWVCFECGFEEQATASLHAH